MPCRCDYLEPTRTEIEQAAQFQKQVKECADNQVHYADMAREAILSKNLTIEHTVYLQKQFSTLNATYTELMHDYASYSSYVKQEVKDEFLKGAGEANKEAEFAYRQLMNYIQDKRVAWKTIEKQQVAHRKADIARVIESLLKKKDFSKIAVAANVDFTKPLEPQLGYDPDSV